MALRQHTSADLLDMSHSSQQAEPQQPKPQQPAPNTFKEEDVPPFEVAQVFGHSQESYKDFKELVLGRQIPPQVNLSASNKSAVCKVQALLEVCLCLFL